jgi:hypothetical protein
MPGSNSGILLNRKVAFALLQIEHALRDKCPWVSTRGRAEIFTLRRNSREQDLRAALAFGAPAPATRARSSRLRSLRAQSVTLCWRPREPLRHIFCRKWALQFE